MGLDVYLCKNPDRAESRRKEQLYEDKSEETWKVFGHGKTYGEMTEEEKDKAQAECDALKRLMGLDKNGSDPQDQRITMDSPIDPEHYFKIGYFRSSYNDGGLNHILRNLGMLDLYGIFAHESGDEYHFAPDWEASLVRANETIEKYAAYLASPKGQFLVSTWDALKTGPISEAEALDLYMAEDAKYEARKASSPEATKQLTCYENALALFFLKGVSLHALISGTRQSWRGSAEPTLYLVYKREETGKENWYLTALKIVRETIEYVLAQPDKEQYYFHWSA